jgi:hypothetical protein
MAPKKTITKRKQDEYKKKCQFSLIANEEIPATEEEMAAQETKYFSPNALGRDVTAQKMFNEYMVMLLMEMHDALCKDKDALASLTAATEDGKTYDLNKGLFRFEGIELSFSKMMTTFLNMSQEEQLRVKIRAEAKLMAMNAVNRIDKLSQDFEKIKQQYNEMAVKVEEADAKAKALFNDVVNKMEN